MCHINVTAVRLQEISQFVVNINTLGRENFVEVENQLVGFFLKERLGFGRQLEPRSLFQNAAV